MLVTVTVTPGTAWYASGATATGVILPAAAVGDVRVIAVAAASSSSAITINTPDGWNPIPPGMLRSSSATTLAGAWFWRAFQAGDPDTVDVTLSSSARIIVCPLTLSGANPSAPVEASNGSAYGSISASANIGAPSLSAAESRLMLCFWATRLTSSGAQGTLTAATGQGMIDLATRCSTSGSINSIGTVSSLVLPAAGATGVKNGRCSLVSTPVAFSLLVEPLAGSVMRTQAGPVEVRRKNG